jgi:hypothetical protein
MPPRAAAASPTGPNVAGRSPSVRRQGDRSAASGPAGEHCAGLPASLCCGVSLLPVPTGSGSFALCCRPPATGPNVAGGSHYVRRQGDRSAASGPAGGARAASLRLPAPDASPPPVAKPALRSLRHVCSGCFGLRRRVPVLSRPAVGMRDGSQCCPRVPFRASTRGRVGSIRTGRQHPDRSAGPDPWAKPAPRSLRLSVQDASSLPASG